MTSIRTQVLAGFKSLHRVARTVFAGDDVALNAARGRINDEFKKNRHVENPASIGEMLKFAQEVETELKTTVVQAKEKQPGVYELKMRENTARLENTMYNEAAVLAKPKSPSQRCKK